MSLWTSADAAAATGGVTGTWVATGVSIDTRTLRPGDLFVALKAERDGHDFVAQALDKGAAAALVTHRPEGVAADAPLLVVPDVLAALERLGAAARARTGARVIAVTGSVGKTSTKEMLRAALASQGRIHAAEASYNNHWGVPLTLARMPADTDFAIIEIGMNHPGEIAPLARLAAPHAAIVTTVAPAHLAAFDGVEAIAQEKAAIFEGLVEGGIAIFPADLAVTPILRAAAGAHVLTFGETAGDLRATEIRQSEIATVVKAEHGAETFVYKIASPGRHFARNALAVVALARAEGLDMALVLADLGHWAPPSGRGTREAIVLDPIDGARFDLVDDAFNANPASMAASLDLVAQMQPEHGIGRIGNGRRIAILGDMLELGALETAFHADIAKDANLAAFALVHCVGPRMRALYDALPRRQKGEWVENAADLAREARSLVDAGDIVLVKGSKGIKVSLVVDALRKLGQGPAASE
ncbi:UDP-N-acetylmuramoyl-tripeptide--D-alanyl-D-alanine ligase [Falsirhodobacter halotolerans]|uniref:UDP-N-acetylmuramoyl-tripeptide--D-alanyl-D- alanine ligase n=1 Tax=Falsirhodobacter halotolerans TaxID=1146892 RepID=UPI001FD1B042|nr:UDP-N-acetylmuramoyl-tripeptide--D-alanyl-D-alanine ligase [Falsirhodobacter halotolerans]MCJ8140309.1 UDP-N-acetylmuramoyl-tripeptide--D-alanyl-D-alanine ligase [Falsirhodobacter halotolerans]